MLTRIIETWDNVGVEPGVKVVLPPDPTLSRGKRVWFVFIGLLQQSMYSREQQTAISEKTIERDCSYVANS